jgi:hypothetical protein
MVCTPSRGGSGRGRRSQSLIRPSPPTEASQRPSALNVTLSVFECRPTTLGRIRFAARSQRRTCPASSVVASNRPVGSKESPKIPPPGLRRTTISFGLRPLRSQTLIASASSPAANRPPVGLNAAAEYWSWCCEGSGSDGSSAAVPPCSLNTAVVLSETAPAVVPSGSSAAALSPPSSSKWVTPINLRVVTSQLLIVPSPATDTSFRPLPNPSTLTPETFRATGGPRGTCASTSQSLIVLSTPSDATSLPS